MLSSSDKRYFLSSGKEMSAFSRSSCSVLRRNEVYLCKDQQETMVCYFILKNAVCVILPYALSETL